MHHLYECDVNAESPFGAKVNQLDLDGIVEVICVSSSASCVRCTLQTLVFVLRQHAAPQDIHNDVRNKIALLGDAHYLASY